MPHASSLPPPSIRPAHLHELHLLPPPPRRPFLMQARMSYTKIGIFSLASYPYSFKLLWSPLVDSLYLPALGRRRTWIIPLQVRSACAPHGLPGWCVCVGCCAWWHRRPGTSPHAPLTWKLPRI